jgi:hypothetical protein
MEDVYIGRHSYSFNENLLIEDYLLRHHCIFLGVVVHVEEFYLFGALIGTFLEYFIMEVVEGFIYKRRMEFISKGVILGGV